MKKVVFLGASYLVKPLIEKLLSSGEEFAFTIFPYKDCLPYAPEQIPLNIQKEIAAEDLYCFNESFCKKHNISILMETVITRINFKKKKIATESKNQYDYDILVVTDVPDNYLPDIKGSGKTGVYAVKKLYDAMSIRHAMIFCDTVIVQTNRFFGLELIKALSSAKKDTICIFPKDFILRKLLSDVVFKWVVAWLEKKGLQVFADASISELLGDADAKAARLDLGKVVAGDLIIFDSGDENYRLFKGTDLNIGDKISVNGQYFTGLEGVYAVDRVIARVDNLSEPVSSGELERQAEVIAASILAREFSQPAVLSTYEWSWDDLSVVILGKCFGSDLAVEESFQESSGAYKRFYSQNGRLVGVVLVNGREEKYSWIEKIGSSYQEISAAVKLQQDAVEDQKRKEREAAAGVPETVATTASRTLEALSQLGRDSGHTGSDHSGHQKIV